jgi:hypothetical protein
MKSTCTVVLALAVLSAPAHGQTQSLRESVAGLSAVDVGRMMDASHVRATQTSPAVKRKHSVRRNALVGALIGLAPGLAAGLFIYKYCNNEVVGGCSIRVPIGFAAAGAGIGAALGAAGTER